MTTTRRALLRKTLLAPLAALVAPRLPSNEASMEKLREELAAWMDFPNDEDIFYESWNPWPEENQT